MNTLIVGDLYTGKTTLAKALKIFIESSNIPRNRTLTDSSFRKVDICEMVASKYNKLSYEMLYKKLRLANLSKNDFIVVTYPIIYKKLDLTKFDRIIHISGKVTV